MSYELFLSQMAILCVACVLFQLVDGQFQILHMFLQVQQTGLHRSLFLFIGLGICFTFLFQLFGQAGIALHLLQPTGSQGEGFFGLEVFQCLIGSGIVDEEFKVLLQYLLCPFGSG